jgi:hypothetical protein
MNFPGRTRNMRKILNFSVLLIGLTTTTIAATQQAKAADTQVNSVTSNWQWNSDVASDPAGNFVVTWESNRQDGYGYGVFARRYNSTGVALGSEFQVNTTTDYDQDSPAIAMDRYGRFVICWVDSSDYSAIVAQRFHADGTKNGGEFRVDTRKFGYLLYAPDIAMSPSGQFVIVWQSDMNYGDSNPDISGQRFTADAWPVGSEFQVNSTTSDEQHNPAVAIADDGKFVVAWTHSPLGPDGYWIGPSYVRTQLFDAAGSPVGSEYLISASSEYEQAHPAVAMHGTGNYLVSWAGARMGADPNTAEVDVYVQAFSSQGAAQGNELRVNSTLAGNQILPSIAMNADGKFVVVWNGAESVAPPENPNAAVFYDVYQQRFSATGVKLGGETRLNSHTIDNQLYPSLALDAAGNTVATWSSWGQDGSAFGVYLKRVEENRSPVAVNDTATLDEDTSASINVRANDSDPNGDPLTITALSAASNGTASLVTASDGTTGILYTPAANYHGPDAFTYTISDGQGGTATATVDITVRSVNDAPTAAADMATTTMNTAVQISVTANDTDSDGDTLGVTAVTQPQRGSSVTISGGSVTYTPKRNFSGSETFSYTVSDGNGGTATTTVTVTVTKEAKGKPVR